MLPKRTRIFVATSPVDLRGAHDKLSGVVRDALKEDPRSGALFVFINRRANRIKILFFDTSGDCILYKRLDHGTFRGIIDLDPDRDRVEIEGERLKALLLGVKKERRRPLLH